MANLKNGSALPFSWKFVLLISLALNTNYLGSVVYDGTVKLLLDLNEKWSPLPEPAQLSNIEDDPEKVINVDHGDPTMYERYWRKMGDKITVTIPGWKYTSYFSDQSRICWFLEPEFGKEIERLHQVVGNAVTEGRHLVVGTGSTQLLQAVLYALSPPDAPEPMNVVSEAPFYSAYPALTDIVKAGIYKWGGDARRFEKDGPYVELVTSPNNPDGVLREGVVKRSGGTVVHDLAYYWPQYTPISSPAEHDLMLFTVSKCTGHAGMRLGWALVKDEEVAKKMTKYIVMTSIGVSKDSQHRAAKVLKAVSDSCNNQTKKGREEGDSFFGYGLKEMTARWTLLRQAVDRSGGQLSLPRYSPGYCNFFGKVLEPQPGFAWLKCEVVEDCRGFLKSNKILARAGENFGFSSKYVRISMMDKDESFYPLAKRLSTLKAPESTPTCKRVF